MPETRWTSFPALFVYPRVGISRSASKTDVRFYLSIKVWRTSNLNSSGLFTAELRPIAYTAKHDLVPLAPFVYKGKQMCVSCLHRTTQPFQDVAAFKNSNETGDILGSMNYELPPLFSSISFSWLGGAVRGLPSMSKPSSPHEKLEHAHELHRRRKRGGQPPPPQ